MFTGFPDETIRFFLDIRFHNNIEYYQVNKDRYIQDVQTPFYNLIGDLIPVVQAIDPQIEIRPYKLLARLRRDTRFSKDKSPYRDHLWVWFKRGGEERWQSLGLWMEFGPDRLMWGMSTWGENRPLMDRFRRELAADPQRIGGIITSCCLPERHLHLTGETFKRIEIPDTVPPHLYPWYCSREPTIIQTQPDMREAASRKLFTHIADDFRAMGPIYQLLRGMKAELEENEAKNLPARPADEW